jgi:N-acetyl-anhydromuramyl-L-alanine amidase AmpD
MELRLNEWPGWVGYKVAESPNYSDRPLFSNVDCIVLHSTAQDSLQDTVTYFENPDSQVSAHFVVDKDGTVVQMVPLTKRAWHAGVSVLDGVPGVNDYSIGIEMVNRNDGKDPYTDAQYHAVAEIIRRCREHYRIPDSRIVSHAEIALPPGRKSDPLGFDFSRLRKLIG